MKAWPHQDEISLLDRTGRELSNNKITGERYEQGEPLLEQLRFNVEQRNIYQSYANAPLVFRGFFTYHFNLQFNAICVHSASRHNIYMYPYFLFAAIHHLYRPRLSLSYLAA